VGWVSGRAAGFGAGAWLLLSSAALAQNLAPPPSQVRPPIIEPPSGGGLIAIPQVPAGAQVPPEARRLSFVLLGFDIRGEFPELAEQRREIEARLVGRITVAQLFEFADQLQQIYVRAGYPLVRVVILPQSLAGSARIELEVIDGFVERMDLSAIAAPVRARVGAVLAPLLDKRHLKQGELERQLLLAGEEPGLILNATFAAGKEVGGSVLVLTGRYRPVSASVYVDDAMPASFGTTQVVTTVAENGLAGVGEQLLVSVAGDPEQDFFTSFPNRRYLSATYTMPLGINGWKLELFATDGRTTPFVPPIAATFGVFDQEHIKLIYEAVKRRDAEFSLHAMFEPTYESLESIAFNPAIPISLDRVRPVRAGFDGIWRERTAGFTLNYGAEISQGLNALGARTAADAAQPGAVPLSQQGADAVFTKVTGHLEANLALPSDFFAALKAYGQDAFGRPLLLSEQYDIDGANMLSGFTTGEFFGDSAWVVRTELGHAFSVALNPATLVATPYVFAASGEIDIFQPTAAQIGSVHVSNYGIGTRFNLPSWAYQIADTYGFVEASNGYVNQVIAPMTAHSSRIFAGILVQY
jgi:hemolysin activation/secretion protein